MTSPAVPYTSRYYTDHARGSNLSASRVLPWLMNWLPCKSAADFGCGIGTWLSIFPQLGITDICGVDGDYVNRSLLMVDPAYFRPADLRKSVRLGRRFDFVMSVEVAEHLPENAAKTYVDTLCAHGDVILFSGATPCQEGDEHINLQWPSYWARLFREHGLSCVDCVRMQFWNDPQVDWWYRQNLLLFASNEHIAQFPEAIAKLASNADPIPLIHPEFAEHLYRQLNEERAKNRTRGMPQPPSPVTVPALWSFGQAPASSPTS